MGENESRQELRELATLEAKRRILEQVGIYIESTTELKQTITENNTKLLDESEFSKEIIAITAGVTNTTIDKEEWKDEDGVFVLYLTCRISVDTEDVNSKIQALVRDRKKLADVKIHQEENARLQSEIVELRNKLEVAKASEVKSIKQKRHVLSSEYSAAEWFNKGFITEDLDKKIEYYSYSIVQNPDWSYPYNGRGLTYYYKGEYHHALTDCNKAIQIDPNYAEAYNNRGITYHAKGEDYLALMDYNKAIQIDPNNATAYSNRGITYHEKGENYLALTDHNKAIQLNQYFATAYCNRGNVYQTLGEYDRAIKDYDKAIKIDPNHAIAYNNRGFAYHDKRKYHRALKDYIKAIRIDPNFAGAYGNRGLTYYFMGKYDKALKAYNKAIQFDTINRKSYYNRGIIYISKGYYDRAIIDFNSAIQVDPNYANAYHNRGMVYLIHFNDKINARNSFRRAMELGHNDAQREWNKLR